MLKPWQQLQAAPTTGMVHVMGSVTAMTDTNISVKATDGKVKTVALTSATKYLRGETSVTL